jgi:hypothetical protein
MRYVINRRRDKLLQLSKQFKSFHHYLFHSLEGSTNLRFNKETFDSQFVILFPPSHKDSGSLCYVGVAQLHYLTVVSYTNQTVVI